MKIGAQHQDDTCEPSEVSASLPARLRAGTWNGVGCSARARIEQR